MSTLQVRNIQGDAASSNTITVASGHNLIAPGHVIQVVNNEPYTTTSSGTSISGTTYAEATELSTSITKKATSSKIICISSVMYGGYYGGAWYKAKAERNGTFVYETAFYEHVQYGSGIENKPIFNFSDDTTSISAGTNLTYRFYFASESASGEIYINWNGSSSNRTTSSIMLMEIAA